MPKRNINFKNKIMKKIIYITILLITALCAAQETVKPLEDYLKGDDQNNDYYKDTNSTLNKFLGTWVYDNGPHYFKIIFYKIEHKNIYDLGFGTPTYNLYIDTIESKFLYQYNGVTVYDTYVNTNTYSKPWDSKIIAGSSIDNITQLSLSYSEPTNAHRRQRKGVLKITYNSSGFPITETLTWNRVDSPMHKLLYRGPAGDLPDTTDFVIPENMVLIKQ